MAGEKGSLSGRTPTAAGGVRIGGLHFPAGSPIITLGSGIQESAESRGRQIMRRLFLMAALVGLAIGIVDRAAAADNNSRQRPGPQYYFQPAPVLSDAGVGSDAADAAERVVSVAAGPSEHDAPARTRGRRIPSTLAVRLPKRPSPSSTATSRQPRRPAPRARPIILITILTTGRAMTTATAGVTRRTRTLLTMAYYSPYAYPGCRYSPYESYTRRTPIRRTCNRMAAPPPTVGPIFYPFWQVYGPGPILQMLGVGQ